MIKMKWEIFIFTALLTISSFLLSYEQRCSYISSSESEQEQTVSIKEELNWSSGYGYEEFQLYSSENVTIEEGKIKLLRTPENILNPLEFSGLIGYGPSNGELGFPVIGIALDDIGNIYVSDTWNHRVQIFDSSGRFLKKFGGYGSEEGMFMYPRGIAVDNARIYVVDSDNHRVQIFDKNSNFINQFGSFGNNASEFKSPKAIAVAENKIYVPDTNNHRVQIFDKDGNFIKQFGRYDPFGEANDSLLYPRGITVDKEGNIYVSDSGEGPFLEFHSKVKVFDENGTLLQTIGAYGEKDIPSPYDDGIEPRFNLPRGLAVDNNSTLYVADTGNNMIKLVDKDGKLMRKIGGAGIFEGKFHYPSGVAVSKNGTIYAIDTFNNRIQIFSNEGHFINAFGNSTFKSGQFAYPMGSAIGKNGMLYVADYAHARVQFFSHGEYKGQFGTIGTGQAQFLDARDIVISTDNDMVYVLDKLRNAVEVFNSAGDYLFVFGSRGSGTGEFTSPQGIALSSKHEVFVLDQGNNRIQIFNSHGNFLGALNGEEMGVELQGSWGLALDKNNNIYVTQTKKHMVLVLSKEGEVLKKVGGLGESAGKFDTPRGITFDPFGNIYVIDGENHRIQMFDSDFNFLREFGGYGTAYRYELTTDEENYSSLPGKFNNPWLGIAFLDGKLYVSDAANSRVQVVQIWGHCYSGSFTAAPYDLKDNSSLLNISWNSVMPSGTELKFQVRTGRNISELLNATWYGPKGKNDYYTKNGTMNPNHTGDRWVQYRVFFSTSNSSSTPTLDNVTITYGYLELAIENVTLVKTKEPLHWYLILIGVIAGVGGVIGYRTLRYRYKLEEVFLVNNAGLVIAHVSKEETHVADEQIVAGMLTAIQDFVKDSFRRGMSEAELKEEKRLGKLEYGKYRIIIERGKDAFLAAVITGYDNPWLRKKMSRVIKIIEQKYEG
ncbi:MAG: 6-bladed beta-propeller, partial [Candidatus Thermoplasmatota archaeon]